ncbi:MAG: alpha/beta hydrolase, partial [Pseudonocardia sp.]|nr:alpha/beta hydrolase [Pseudonocardia sp.]
LGFAVLVARPGTTEPVPGPDAVAELATVRLGGHDQTVMLRGRDDRAPILLYLAGGPGGTDLGAMRLFGEQLESDFLVATWDQRGAGTSYGALDPTSTLTPAQVVADTVELAQTLRDRFDQDRVYLVGNSYGALIGVLAAQQRPDLFAAYVGTGQMVDVAETDRIFYADTLDWARRTGDDALLETVTRSGPPPYAEVYPYEAALSHGHAWHDDPAFDPSGEMPANLLVEEYDLVQKVRGLPAFIDTFAVLYPQLQDLDLRTRAAQLQVPVYVVTGEFEARGRVGPAREWFDGLAAPDKRWIELPDAGHRPHFEQPDAFAALMRTVLSQTR